MRPEGRRGPLGLQRCAERKEAGASLANVRAGKVRGWGVVLSVIEAVRGAEEWGSELGVAGLEELGMWIFWGGLSIRNR